MKPLNGSVDLSGTNFRVPPQEIFEAARKVTRWFAENDISDYTIAGIGPRSTECAHEWSDAGDSMRCDHCGAVK